ncbi:thioredoxin family protein [Lactobacillus ultunensis]|uniref:Thioredoxin domain-containing protein n=1 Tax=Lactobacillus ultunensis DSM 16047 TaxID=525365 RepID=C2ER60_9LACO|nr:thioredoxin family protein [Lactobacillus ultunensis]EEJ70949.1 hypothetical protein HMPREF0548_2156 [Lactobacillus ultunensis DSM 16047]KRL79747.1 thioredoxin [Lactobacillus ultunensis DSM 16047]QQP28973.1 thioredoxin family protein [Lactobacillus ultunensis]
MNKIIYFYDDGCAHCFTEGRILDQLDPYAGGSFNIERIKVSENQKLAQKFAIYSTPTIVFVKDNKVVEQYSHDLSFSQIKTVINYYFGGLKMFKKNEDKKDKMINIIGSDDQKGVCGPDGCVINWDKDEKNDVKKN